MSDLQALERRREEILESMARVGDMRRGSVSEQYLRSPSRGGGKGARRGPYYVFSRKVEGKTHSRRVRGREMERLKREVSNYHRFQQLSLELVELSEKICDLKAGSRRQGGKKNSRRRSSGRGSGRSGSS